MFGVGAGGQSRLLGPGQLQRRRIQRGTQPLIQIVQRSEERGNHEHGVRRLQQFTALKPAQPRDPVAQPFHSFLTQPVYLSLEVEQAQGRIDTTGRGDGQTRPGKPAHRIQHWALDAEQFRGVPVTEQFVAHHTPLCN